MNILMNKNMLTVCVSKKRGIIMAIDYKLNGHIEFNKTSEELAKSHIKLTTTKSCLEGNGGSFSNILSELGVDMI